MKKKKNARETETKLNPVVKARFRCQIDLLIFL